MGDRRAGDDAVEEEDMIADTAEEAGAEGIEDVVLVEALEDTRGDEGGAYVPHKVV